MSKTGKIKVITFPLLDLNPRPCEHETTPLPTAPQNQVNSNYQTDIWNKVIMRAQSLRYPVASDGEKRIWGVDRWFVSLGRMPEIIKSMTSLLGVPITRRGGRREEGCKRTRRRRKNGRYDATTALNHFYPSLTPSSAPPYRLFPIIPRPKPSSLFSLPPSLVKVS